MAPLSSVYPILYSMIVIAACFVTSSRAFTFISSGRCPDVPVMQDFDIKRYVGRWYSYETFDGPFQFGLSCVSVDYSLTPGGNVQVRSTGLRDIRIAGRSLLRSPDIKFSKARIVDTFHPAALYISSSFGHGNRNTKPNYLIVDTDYTNYSLVYSCTQPYILPFKVEFAWILTRQRAVRPPGLDAIKSGLRKYGIDTDNFKMVDNSNC